MKKFLALLSLSLLVMVGGCAALGPALSVLDHVANDSESVLKIIETTYNVYETQHPVSPEDNLAFQKILASAYADLNAGTRALSTAHEVDQGQYDAAYADFKKDFADLEAFLKAHHISPIGTGIIGDSQNGGQDFPAPAVIGFRISK